jgi:hypothetical protein
VFPDNILSERLLIKCWIKETKLEKNEEQSKRERGWIKKCVEFELWNEVLRLRKNIQKRRTSG